MKYAIFSLVLIGCGHWNYNTVSGKSVPSPDYVLLTHYSHFRCQDNEDFDEASLVKEAMFSITKQADADGVLNCYWSVEAQVNSQSCLSMTCRPYKLFKKEEVMPPHVDSGLANPFPENK